MFLTTSDNTQKEFVPKSKIQTAISKKLNPNIKSKRENTKLLLPKRKLWYLLLRLRLHCDCHERDSRERFYRERERERERERGAYDTTGREVRGVFEWRERGREIIPNGRIDRKFHVPDSSSFFFNP